MTFEVGPAGESAMRLIFSEPPQPALTRRLLSIQDAAQHHFGETLADSVIGYTTLTLFFTPFKFERDRAEAWLLEQADNPLPETSRTRRTHRAAGCTPGVLSPKRRARSRVACGRHGPEC